MSWTEELSVVQTDYIQNHGKFRKQITEMLANHYFFLPQLNKFWVVNEVADKM